MARFQIGKTRTGADGRRTLEAAGMTGTAHLAQERAMEGKAIGLSETWCEAQISHSMGKIGDTHFRNTHKYYIIDITIKYLSYDYL